MSTERQDSSWFSEEQAVLVFTLVTVLLAAVVILPYLQYVLFGIIFAYVLWPIQRRLSQYIRRDFAALLLTIGTIIAVPLPFIYLFARLVQEAFALLEAIEAEDLDPGAVEDWLREFGIVINLEDVFEANQDRIADGLEMLARALLDVVQSLPNIFIGLTITIFVLFVLLRDGPELVAWTRNILPIRDEIQDELNYRLNRLMWASIVGNGGAGLIQAIALGVGLWFLGFENVIFLTVLTFILALLPLVGAFLVWIPLVIYLLVIGDFVTALMLLVYGSVVSASDFYTRPIIIGHSAELNSAIIVVGVFGGLVAFGPVGLLIGPVILGGSKIAVEALVRARDNDLNNVGSSESL